MKINVRVLVTGGLGYVGSVLLPRLEDLGTEYLSVDKRYTASSGRERAIDLRDRGAAAGLIAEFRPELIIHCGTHSALAYRDDLVGAFREDAEVSANLLEALGASPACRLVYFSSTYAYSGLPRRERVSEQTVLRPSHNFGVAKAFFEQLMLRGHPNTVVFRLSSVFGPGSAVHPNAVYEMARECLNSGRVTVWGSGTRNMQYVYIDDVAHCVLQADALEPGIYNLGGDEYPTIADVAGMIGQLFGAEVAFLRDKREGETLPLMDTTKLKTALGYRFTPFETALEAYLRPMLSGSRQG